MRRDPRRRAGVAVVLLATAALALLPALPASAHDYLVSSDPGYDSTVTAPVHTVSLTFDAGVLDFGAGSDGIIVTGPGSSTRHFETGCAHVSGDTVTAPVALGAPGKYAVSWRIVSADGHPVSDTITFTYHPAAGTVAAPGSTSGPDCKVSINRAAHFGAPGDTTNTGLAALVIGIAVGVAVLIAAVLIVAVVIIRRTGRGTP